MIWILDPVWVTATRKIGLKGGFGMGFSASSHKVDTDLDSITSLLSKARELYELPKAPQKRKGCHECANIENLIHAAR
jgi:hypothetical protein